jgi:hypothetical protein
MAWRGTHRQGQSEPHYWLSRVPAIRYLQENNLDSALPFSGEVGTNSTGTVSVEILWIQETSISQTIGECEIDLRVLAAKAGSSV